MSFAAQLQAAKGDLTARQVAAAVSPLLSVRTVEKWLAGDNEPPRWTHDWIISRVRREPGRNQQIFRFSRAAPAPVQQVRSTKV